MAVFHADDVRFLDQFFERRNGNCELVISGIVINKDAQPGKHIRDLMVELDCVLHMQCFIVRNSKENTVCCKILTKFIFCTTSLGLGLVQPMKSGTLLFTASTVAAASVLNSSHSRL